MGEVVAVAATTELSPCAVVSRYTLLFCHAGLKALKVDPDESGLSELLNMAYAQHEIIADTTTKMLDWFEKQPPVAAAAAAGTDKLD